MKTIRHWVIRILILIILLVLGGGFYYWHLSYLNRDNPFFGFVIGGFPPGYKPQAHDPRLEPIAEQMRPIIEKIETLRKTTGHYPLQLEDEALRDGIQVHHTKVMILYDPTDQQSSGYSLLARIGWDPSLTYNQTPDKKGWFFDPGDGEPDIPVDL
jgi:hypothetical protein